MRNSVSIKIAVLVPLILITRFLATEILARNASTPPAVREGAVMLVNHPDKSKPLPTFQFRPNNGPLATSQLIDHSIQVLGNDVQMTASVALTNRSGASSYLWRLRVIREFDGTLVMDKPYVEQLFEMDPSGSMSPTFAEVFQLPAGKHRVVLSLYGVPKGYDVTELNDNVKAHAATLIQIPEMIQIN